MLMTVVFRPISHQVSLVPEPFICAYGAAVIDILSPLAEEGLLWEYIEYIFGLLFFRPLIADFGLAGNLAEAKT